MSFIEFEHYVQPDMKKNLHEFFISNPNFIFSNAKRLNIHPTVHSSIFKIANRYREENQGLRNLLNEFVQIVDKNFQIYRSLSELRSSFWNHQDFDSMVRFLLNSFKEKFKLNYFTIHLQDIYEDNLSKKILLKGHSNYQLIINQGFSYQQIFRKANYRILNRKTKLFKQIIPANMLEAVNSVLLIPLKFNNKKVGFFVFASLKKKRFDNDLNYDFMIETADLIAEWLVFSLSKDKISQSMEKLSMRKINKCLNIFKQVYFKQKDFSYIKIKLTSVDKNFLPGFRKKIHCNDLAFIDENNILYILPLDDGMNAELFIKRIKNEFNFDSNEIRLQTFT